MPDPTIDPRGSLPVGPHLDDEQIALIASGAEMPSSAPPLEAPHLEGCERCRRAVEMARRSLRALASPVELSDPPPGLWDRIAADLEEDGADAEGSPAPAAPGTGGAVIELSSRRRRRWILPAVAAVAGLIVGAGSIGLLGARESSPPASVALGDAELAPLAAEDFSGRAEMVQRPDGTIELTVEVPSTPDPADGYLEVWLRDEGASRLISLGPVTETTTTVQVPEGIDFDQYPIVDVSHEHFDGDPTHSGVTLAAGPMRPAG